MTEVLQQQDNASLSNALSNNSMGADSPTEIADNQKDSLSTSPTVSSSSSEEPKKIRKAPALLRQVVRLGAMGLGMNLGPDDDRLDASKYHQDRFPGEIFMLFLCFFQVV